VDLAAEKRNGDFVRGQIREGRTVAVHDLSDGGLACAAAEMAMASGCGAKLAHTGSVPLFAWMFGEDQGRYLIAAKPEAAEAMRAAAKQAGVPLAVVGLAGGRFVSVNGGHAVDIIRLKQAHENWMPNLMAGEPEAKAAE
jgi:phosphoribosylformylglycinamidine synthase